jgi:hypothetical protein
MVQIQWFSEPSVYTELFNSLCFPTSLSLGVIIIFLSTAVHLAFNCKLFGLTFASDCLHLTLARWTRSDLISFSPWISSSQGHIHSSSKDNTADAGGRVRSKINLIVGVFFFCKSLNNEDDLSLFFPYKYPLILALSQFLKIFSFTIFFLLRIWMLIYKGQPSCRRNTSDHPGVRLFLCHRSYS